MTTTPNLNLTLPVFDEIPWHDQVNDNFRKIDAVIASTFGISNLSGKWCNSTAVSEGAFYFDVVSGIYYKVLVAHTTPTLPTSFAESRSANPTFWQPLDSGASFVAVEEAITARDAVLTALATVEANAAEVAATQAEIDTFTDFGKSLLELPNLFAYNSFVSGNSKVDMPNLSQINPVGNAALLQAAMNDAVLEGKVFVSQPILYPMDDDVLLPSGLRWEGNGVRLQRRYVGGNNVKFGMLKTPSLSVSRNNLRIERVYLDAETDPLTGNPFSGNGLIGLFKDSEFYDFRIENYWGDQAFIFGTERCLFENPYAYTEDTSGGTGAIRWISGLDSVIRGLRGQSGDDFAQFVPQVNTAQSFLNCHLSDAVGKSTGGRIAIAFLDNQCTGTIINCSMDVKGYGSKRVVVVSNTGVAGQAYIERLTMQVDAVNRPDLINLQAVLIDGDVRDSDFNIRIRSPQAQLLRVSSTPQTGAPSRNVIRIGANEAPTSGASGTPVVTCAAGKDNVIIPNIVARPLAASILVQSLAENTTVKDGCIRGLVDGDTGIRKDTSSNDIAIHNMTFEGDGVAISFQSPATYRDIITGCDFGENTILDAGQARLTNNRPNAYDGQGLRKFNTYGMTTQEEGGYLTVQYSSNRSDVNQYGVTANVKRTGGTKRPVAGQLNAYSLDPIGSNPSTVFGLACEAWSGDAATEPLVSVGLKGVEPAVLSQFHSNADALWGIDAVFKNRPDNGSVKHGSIGNNCYNRYSRAFNVSAQNRSPLGEFCGWHRGIYFAASSLDFSIDGGAIGIDFSDAPTPRMSYAMLLATTQKIGFTGNDGPVDIHINADEEENSFNIRLNTGTPISFDLAGANMGMKVAGVKVVGQQRPAIPNAVAGTEVATINSMLAAMRAHGLINT